MFFSFNGLDSVTPDRRQLALREIIRVAKPGAVFCFSSHNLQGIGKLFRLYVGPDLPRFWRTLKRALRVRLYNESLATLLQRRTAMIREPHAPLTTYYTTLAAEILELEQSGFREIDVYGLDGQIVDQANIATHRDPWLYYFCRTPA